MNDIEMISIIIPTYQRPQFIKRAIESCLSQTGVKIEIIVVDDNGLDSKKQIELKNMLYEYIKSGSVKYIAHQKNMMASAARNTGASKATGTYIAFLDDDDWFENNKLHIQLEYMKVTNSGACLCGFRRIYANKQVESVPLLDGDLNFRLLSFNVDHCAGSTLLMKKEIFDKIGGFDESFVRHQDIEFIYRVSKETTISVAPQILANIFMHKDNTMKKDANYIRDNRMHFVKTFWEEINCLEKQQRNRTLDTHYIEIAKAFIKQYSFFEAIRWIIKTSNPLHSTRKIIHDTKVHFSDRWVANS